jgi:hypothetical protein
MTRAPLRWLSFVPALIWLCMDPSRARADDVAPSVFLDGVFTYGIGGQSALGGELHGTASWTVAHGDVDLALDLGLRLGYEAEPSALATWVDASEVSSIAHRVRTHVTAGPTLRFGGAARELSLGLHLYAGPTYWESEAHIRFAPYAVDTQARTAAMVFDAGAFLRFTWRPDPAVGIAIVAGAPFWDIASSYVVDLFHVGLGLAFRLR